MRNISTDNQRRGIMPAVVIAAGALLLTLAFAFLSGCGGESAADLTTDTGGRIQITETSFDFGSVPVDTQVQHEYEIKNVGTGPLQMGDLSVKRLEGC